ncbi:YciI family protein [Corynebacterium comes]|uniref:YCII-related domain protein n=1 Tax=Corynebacterium comes TaxID=2675218 RepID=A0A6B8VTY9_9CORY|nr:YciI family protein [Corynebacterium comes]QGU03481.1 YCII-related domain protein [Corynebacterium comes]
MTNFMLSVHHVPGTAPYASEDDMKAAFEAVGAFNERLLSDGVLVHVNALLPDAVVVTADSRSEGPAHEGAQLGGFWIIDVADRAAAEDLAREASAACGQPIEVRQFEG